MLTTNAIYVIIMLRIHVITVPGISLFTWHANQTKITYTYDPQIYCAFQIMCSFLLTIAVKWKTAMWFSYFLARWHCFAKALQQVIDQIVIMLMGCKNSNSNRSRASMMMVYIHKLWFIHYSHNRNEFIGVNVQCRLFCLFEQWMCTSDELCV